MSENARKDRLIREALGACDAPMPTAELTPRIVYVGLVLLVVAAISGGLRLDAGIPDAQAVMAATAQLAPSPDAESGNVQDLTY